MPDDPERFLDTALLRRLAGEQFYARGEAYFADGRVRQLHASPDRVTGRVEGSRAYRVKLWRSRGEFQFSCTCAAGLERAFCKHCVAVGLAWLAVPGASGEPAPATDPAPPGRTPEEAAAREAIAAHLRTVPRERLFALILEATDYDDILRRRLLLEAVGVAPSERSRRPAAPPPDLKAYRRLLREAIATADYVDYDAMPDYAQGVQEAVAPLGNLLGDGHEAAVIALVEGALVELDKVSDLLDGSDGSLNAVYDDLQRYHLEACRLAHPPAKALAARLLEYEIEGGLGVFNNALKTYADVLGPEGTQHWRRRLVEEWERLPAAPVGPGASLDHRRFQLRALMERLAESEGDAEALLRIRERDLSGAHDYLSLAELLAARGRDELAVQRAEEGLRLFAAAGDDTAGLRDFLAAACERIGRHERAGELIWEEFARTGDPADYRRLRAHVQSHEPAAWPAWRERALTHLRERLAREKSAARHQVRTHPPDGSAAVAILLEEARDEDAWHEALAHGCRADLWLALAARREPSHPADALGVYQARLSPVIATGGTTAYREAIELLARIRGLFDRLGRPGDFVPYREEVRAAHRGRRGFTKLLDAADR